MAPKQTYERTPDYQRGKVDALQNLLHLVIAALPDEKSSVFRKLCWDHAHALRKEAEAKRDEALLDEAEAAWEVANELDRAVQTRPRVRRAAAA